MKGSTAMYYSKAFMEELMDYFIMALGLTRYAEDETKEPMVRIMLSNANGLMLSAKSYIEDLLESAPE